MRNEMRKPMLRLTSVLAVVMLLSTIQLLEAQENRARPRPQTWVDCELFAGVVTPATFDPNSDPFDELYTGGNGFLNWAPLISESKPGDQDYNGGRWHLNVLRIDVNPDKYATACTVEDLDLSDFEPMDSYFECPLLPRRGRGRGRN